MFVKQRQAILWLLIALLTACTPLPSSSDLQIQNLSATEITLGTVELSFQVRSDTALERVLIDWGDGQVNQIDTDFAMVTTRHDYDNWQNYLITVTAISSSGKELSESISIIINQPPESCITPPVANVLGEFCAAFSLDFLKLRVFYRNGDLEIDIVTLDQSNPSIRLPALFLPPFLFAFIELGFDFDTQLLSITLESCPIIGCFQLWNGSLQL